MLAPELPWPQEAPARFAGVAAPGLCAAFAQPGLFEAVVPALLHPAVGVPGVQGAA
jgi:hypothetical protein